MLNNYYPKKKKKMNNIIKTQILIITILCIGLTGCRWGEYKSNFQNEPPTPAVKPRSVWSQELSDTLVNDWLEFKKTFLHISPNPTSSSVTIYFAHNPAHPTKTIEFMPGKPYRWPEEYWFPLDVSVDLYHLEKLIHTIDFWQSNGIETIPAEYLHLEGTWTAVARLHPDWRPTYHTRIFTTTFLVNK